MRRALTLLALAALLCVGVGIETQLWGLAAVGGLIWIDLGRRGSK